MPRLERFNTKKLWQMPLIPGLNCVIAAIDLIIHFWRICRALLAEGIRTTADQKAINGISNIPRFICAPEFSSRW